MIGRIRQGDLVGLSRRAKRLVTAYYSPGESRVVDKAGSGIKGNHHLEKDLIFEFTVKFLGNVSLNISRQLLANSVAKVKCETVLKRDKLVKEMVADTDNETSRLFNSVSHVQKSVRGQLEDVDEDVSEYEREHARVMEEEYEIAREETVLPTIDELEENETQPTAQNQVINGPCVSDMWVKGWAALEKMNLKSSRSKQRERLDRKRKVQKVILHHVQQLKENAGNVIIDAEVPAQLASMHSDYLRSLDSARYKD